MFVNKIESKKRHEERKMEIKQVEMSSGTSQKGWREVDWWSLNIWGELGDGMELIFPNFIHRENKIFIQLITVAWRGEKVLIYLKFECGSWSFGSCGRRLIIVCDD